MSERIIRVCKICKHMAEIHYEDGQCGRVMLLEPTKEESYYDPDYPGTWNFCDCPGLQL